MHKQLTLLAFSCCLFNLASAQPQPPTPTQATVILPAQVTVASPSSQIQPSETQQQPPTPPQPSTTQQPQPPTPPLPPTPTVPSSIPITAPAPECPPLDQFIREHYDAFFLLTRLVNSYTLQNEPSNTPPLNASYSPLTILAPTTKSVVQFLMNNKINVRELASSPLQSVLLAPTLSGHFVRGFYPASALPTSPVDTLCGNYCGNITFKPSQPPPQVQTIFQSNPQQQPYPVNTTIITPNVAVCQDQWVIHEVDGLLYIPVKNPLDAASPALDVSYALNGQWNSFNVAGNE